MKIYCMIKLQEMVKFSILHSALGTVEMPDGEICQAFILS